MISTKFLSNILRKVAGNCFFNSVLPTMWMDSDFLAYCPYPQEVGWNSSKLSVYSGKSLWTEEGRHRKVRPAKAAGSMNNPVEQNQVFNPLHPP